MSAVPVDDRDERMLVPIAFADLDAVLAIETAAYPFPWSRGNFVDSLAAGYDLEALRTPRGDWLGYFVAMQGIDEMHLLNLTINPAHQRRGHARYLLDALRRRCSEHGAAHLWLEARESNGRARALYERYGFKRVGTRRGYYPAEGGRREDAIVMMLKTASGEPA